MNIYDWFINFFKLKSIKKKFPSALPFKNGYAKIQGSSVFSWGLIDKKGNIVIEPKYYSIGEVKDGLVKLILKEDKKLTEGFYNIKKGTIEWNNNLDRINELREKTEIFRKSCEEILDVLFKEKKSCPCTLKRFRRFIEWTEPIQFLDQEILFDCLIKHLNPVEKSVDNFRILECPICKTQYKEHWEQYSAFLWVLNVIVIKEGVYPQKGEPLEKLTPYFLGFQGYSSPKKVDQMYSAKMGEVLKYIME